MVFSVLALLAVFGFSEPHARLGFTGIPPRRFTLPVRTSALVGWPVLLGCGTMLIFYFAWSRLVIRYLLPEDFGMPHLYLSTLLCAGLSIFQASVWGLVSFPKLRMGLVVALILGVLGVGGYGLGMQEAAIKDSSSGWNHVRLAISGGFAIAWTAGVFGSFAGVGLERCGTWAGSDSLLRRIAAIELPNVRVAGFGSPFFAQLWIEWRRSFRMPLIVWTLAIWVCFALVVVGAGLGLQMSAHDMIFFIAGGFGFGCVAVLGLNIARDAGSCGLLLSSFSGTRPVGTQTLVSAKLVMAVFAWGLAMCVLMISVAAALKTSEEIGLVPELDWNPLSVGFQFGWISNWQAITLALLALSLHLFVGILPLSASGRTPGFPWSLFPMILLYGGAINLYSWFDRHWNWRWLGMALLVGYVLLKLGIALWAFRKAIARRIVTGRFVVGYCGIWVFVTGLIVWAVVGAGENFNHSPWVLTFAAFSVVPLARVALLPLAMAMNRHR